MGVPLVVLTIAALLHSTLAGETCQRADQVIASSVDQSYYFKCLAAGVSVQLKCPPGLYFPQGGQTCISSLALVKLPEPQIPVHKEPVVEEDVQSLQNLPTAPTPAATAPTKKPAIVESNSNNEQDNGSVQLPVAPVNDNSQDENDEPKGPATAPPSPPNAKKGQKTTKRQRATTAAPKNLSKRKTTAGAKSQKSASKTVAPKRRKVQN